MKVLVFGGSSFMGRSALKQLHAAGHQVTVATRSPEKVATLDIPTLKLERKSADSVAKVLKMAKPDVLLDMICYDEEDAVTLLEGIKQCGITPEHYLMVSSFFVYHHLAEWEAPATVPETMDDRYTYNKLAAEHRLQNSPLHERTTYLRFPFIISANDVTGRFQRLIHQVLEGRKPGHPDSGKMQFITKREGGRILCELASLPPQGVIDVSNGECLESETLYRLLEETFHHPPEPLEGDEPCPYHVSRDLCMPGTRLKKLLKRPLLTMEEQLIMEAKRYAYRHTL